MIEELKHPNSLKYSFDSIVTDGGKCKLVFTMPVNYDYEYFGIGKQIRVVTNTFNGIFTILNHESTGYTDLKLIINKAFVSNETGIIYTNPQISQNSNFCAVNNIPCYFEFQRKDIIPIEFSNFNGKVRLKISGNYTDYLLQNNEYIYLNAKDANGVLIHNLAAVIGSMTYYSIPDYSLLDLNLDYISAPTYFFINSNNYRKNYYLEIVISLPEYNETITTKFYPSPKGIISADIHGFLENYLSQKDENTFNNIVFHDSKLKSYFSITYTEKYV